ncbi:MAG: signal peptidase I [Rickettsiales bacterium]|nr:signal peptidase I [Rickettsiales bacterium]
MTKAEKKISTKNSSNQLSFFKTLIIALICAGFVRSFFFEPFHIPSGSMKPGLLIGDYIFVSKYSYGYSRYSFPFGIKFFSGRIWQTKPQRGDVIVFRLPSDPTINYVKRLIGFPGDKIQMRDGVLYINDLEVKKISDGIFDDSDKINGDKKIDQFFETLPEGKIVETLDQTSNAPQDNTGIYEVPQGHYFMMGDNRDNSQDSRFLTQVGYVPEENLIGKAQIIFFSAKNNIWEFWNWPNSIRFNRIFTKVK